jgi:hypothetical protein
MSNCDLILLAEDDSIKEVDEKDSFLANSDHKSTSDKFNEKLKENELKPNQYSNPNQPKDRYRFVNLFFVNLFHYELINDSNINSTNFYSNILIEKLFLFK